MMVRNSDFVTVGDLTIKAEEYEAYKQERNSFRPPSPAQVLVQETAYVPKRRPGTGTGSQQPI